MNDTYQSTDIYRDPIGRRDGPLPVDAGEYQSTDIYKDPVGRVAEGPPLPPESTIDAADIGKGAVGGLGRGVTGLLGLPGDVAELMGAGGKWIGDKLGLPPLPADVKNSRPFSSAEVRVPVENITGEFYKPTTKLGKYASTIGEFAPAAVMPGSAAARVFNTVAPAIASEAAGQYTEGTAAEPYARAMGGVLGGVTAAKALTPTVAPTAARRAATAALEREGIPLTAGDRTGSKLIGLAESVAADMPFSSGAAQAQQQARNAALDQAYTRRLFDPAELQRRGLPPEAALPDPNVMRVGRESLSDRYTQLAQANAARADPQLVRSLHQAPANYERLTLPSQRAGGARDVNAIRDEIVNSYLQGGGSMPGDVYQAMRSRLGTMAKSAEKSDVQLANTLRDMRGALDANMQRSLSPADAADWVENNRRWANMRQVEKAVAASKETLSAAQMAQAVRSGRAGQAAQGLGDMDELARASAAVFKPIPNSMTAARSNHSALFNIPNALMAGGGALGSAFGPIGTAIGVAAPHMVSRAVISRPGQAYLGNQFLPQNTRDVLAQTMAQQAISQPSGIDRNDAERAANERKRIQDRRDAGLPVN